jgi:hypothetical protein
LNTAQLKEGRDSRLKKMLVGYPNANLIKDLLC